MAALPPSTTSPRFVVDDLDGRIRTDHAAHFDRTDPANESHPLNFELELLVQQLVQNDIGLHDDGTLTVARGQIVGVLGRAQL